MGINSAAPPLADDIYMFGSAQERFIVRMGMTLNQALYEESNGKEGWVEQLGYAMLSIPAGAPLPRLIAELQLKEQAVFIVTTQSLIRAWPRRSARPVKLAAMTG